MRRLLAAAAAGLALVAASPAAALDTSQLDPSLCPGTVVVDTVEVVKNNIDSGMAGWWASIDYQRRVVITETAPGSFCIVETNAGHFITFEGRSPGDTADITEGIKGKFLGGYRATFTGTFAPTRKTEGGLGSVDYACPESGPPCPGRERFVDYYFGGSVNDFTYAWWGWEYDGKSHGTWTNTIAGNSGDVT